MERLDEVSMDVIARSVKAAAKDIDIKPYLDSVTAASQRTRSVLYIIVVAIATSFVAYRTVAFPDATNERLAAFRDGLTYRNQDLSKVNNPERQKAIQNHLKYTVRAMDPLLFREEISSAQSAPSGPFGGSKTEGERELRQVIDNLIRRKIERSNITLPVLGYAIDVNDFVLLSGFLFILLLVLLGAALIREVGNIARTRMRAKAIGVSDNLELLLMSQVLSSVNLNKSIKEADASGLRHVRQLFRLLRMNPRALSSVIRRICIFPLFYVPATIQFFWCLYDNSTFGVGEALEGSIAMGVEMVIEWTCFLVIAGLGVFCNVLWLRVEAELGKVEDDFNELSKEKTLYGTLVRLTASHFHLLTPNGQEKAVIVSGDTGFVVSKSSAERAQYIGCPAVVTVAPGDSGMLFAHTVHVLNSPEASTTMDSR